MLYRYRPAKNEKELNRLLSEIDGWLWFSYAQFLNDPFDGLSRLIDEKRIALDTFNGLREYIRYKTRWGVACFSKEWNIVPMWAHYTQYSGVCLGYSIDILSKNIERYNNSVLPEGMSWENNDYQNDPELGWRSLISLKKVKYKKALSPSYKDGKKALTNKMKAWKYEKEYRMLLETPLETPESPGKKFYLTPDPLLEVIFGFNTDEDTKAAIKEIIEKRGSQVKFMQLEISKDSSRLERKPVF